MNLKPSKPDVKQHPSVIVSEEYEILEEIKVTISAKLGSCVMYVRDLLELDIDALVQLDRLAGDSADILINGVPIARGEVIMIGQSFGVRITEFLSLKK
jgi:flagellar motor switch protein FliN